MPRLDDDTIRLGESYDPTVRALERKLAAANEERDHYRDLAKGGARRVSQGRSLFVSKGSGVQFGAQVVKLVRSFVEKRNKELEAALLKRMAGLEEELETALAMIAELEARVTTKAAGD